MIENRMLARWWFGATSVAVAVGLGVQVYDTANSTAGQWSSTGTRLLNILFFFTIDSNILVCLATGLLAWRLERTSTVFASLRMAGLVGITITGIVYHAVLNGLVELDGAGLVADILLHTVSPILVVLGWLVFGPRRLTTSAAIRFSLLFPVLYLAVTLIRGPIVHWYPYPFLDVASKGYVEVLVGCALVAALFFAVAFGAAALDRLLARRIERIDPE